MVIGDERKQEIIDDLNKVLSYLKEENNDPHVTITMFDVISYYTNNYDNKELVGGTWVRENCPEPLKSLPA